jgi:RsmE family RNA methyltransferase
VNLLLFSATDRIDAARIRINDGRLQHLLEVHRASPGDRVRVGEIGGLMGDGTIEHLDRGSATLKVTLATPPPAKLPLRLAVALPRPKMLRRVLRTVAEFGVPELHLIHSYRVEKSYWQTPVLAESSVRDYLLQGLQQSRDTVLPLVHCQRRFKPFAEDLLPHLTSAHRALLAHPGDFPPCPHGLQEPTLVVIGPEGGFIPYEVDKLIDAGCQPVSLGPRILRVENAVTAVMSRLS